jgi:hypothetical protein
MAHVVLPDDDALVRMQHPEFDPYAATGGFMLKLIDELIASGHPIGGAQARAVRS